MVTRESIVAIAKAEIGTKENPKNSNKTKYGEWFGWNGVAWCGIFVSWVFYKAGINLGKYKLGFTKGFAGCDTALAKFRAMGMATVNPMPGDIVFFQFDSDPGAEHVGIYAERLGPDLHYIIEGNTTAEGVTGSQSDGGEVCLRKRKQALVLEFISIKKLLDGSI